MKKTRNKNTLIIVALLVVITLGYAYLSQILTINGTGIVDNMSWDIHFENYQATSNSNVTPSTVPDTSGNNKTTISYVLTFTEPGQIYEFTVDTKNAGTLDAMIKSYQSTLQVGSGEAVDATVPSNIPSYLNYSITYSDDVAIQNNHLLAANTKETIKVHLELKKDINTTQLQEASGKTITLTTTINYEQTDGNEVPVRVEDADFTTDSWDNIIEASKATNPTTLQQQMAAGTTREVQLDLDNDGTPETTRHLRIANLSTPTECKNAGFSQTACGLVLEFADIITTHRMNPYDQSGNVDGDGNRGGWPASEMRTYLNTDIYNALPADLRSVIIPTTVVSGYGSKDSANFTSTDKLYLLSPHEVWEDVDGDISSGIDYYDKSYSNTRQLDYYSSKEVTTSSYSAAIKQNNGSNAYWWLRSARSNYNNAFFRVTGNGHWDGNYTMSTSADTDGVSPAFRIG